MFCGGAIETAPPDTWRACEIARPMLLLLARKGQPGDLSDEPMLSERAGHIAVAEASEAPLQNMLHTTEKHIT